MHPWGEAAAISFVLAAPAFPDEACRPRTSIFQQVMEDA